MRKRRDRVHVAREREEKPIEPQDIHGEKRYSHRRRGENPSPREKPDREPSPERHPENEKNERRERRPHPP
jgi:hypothetical protein